MLANVALKSRNGLESVYPCRFRPVQQCDYGVVPHRRLAPEPHSFGQNATTRLPQQLFVAAEGQPGQPQKKIDHPQIEKWMPNFDWDMGSTGIEILKKVLPTHVCH